MAAADNIVRFSRPFFENVRDSFANFLAGFGMPGRDKMLAQHWALNIIGVDQLESAYRGDWVARKIIEIPAFDATRAWRQWQADKEDVKAIEKVEKQVGMQTKMLQGMIKARLYGGAALVMGVDQGTFQDELDVEAVGKDDLKFVHVVPRWSLGTGPMVREITSPWYGEPTYYQRSNTITPESPAGVQPVGQPELGTKPGEQLYIHPSRVVRLIGLDYPDWERAPDVWGDSVLQPVADALRSAGMVSGSFATMIAEAKIDVIKVPGLTAKMQTDDGTNTLFNRFSKTNVSKSVINALLLDKEDEWERMQLQLEGMDKVLQSYFLVCCAAADIPATRFMGREPAGLNATGDSDTRNYYDRLASDQKVRITPAMSRLDEVIIRSALGSRDEAIDYHWKTLWLKSDSEKADEELRKAQAHQIDVNAGLISPHVLQTGRQNSLIESGYLYPGIEQAIEEEGEWDAEEGVDEARTKGLQDPNDPDIIAEKAKATALNKPPPMVAKSNGSSRGS
jgi:uncharacterized protein